MIGMFGRRDSKYVTFNKEIVDIIYKYKMTPLGIILDFNNEVKDEFNNIKPLLDLCDGFILQGGDDYHDIDIMITKYLYDINIPTFGICLGMQQMAVAFNGIMNDIDNHQSLDKYVHAVKIVESSKLYDILDKKEIMVNSRHKSYILKTALNISSKSNVIESIEDKTKLFFIGVQWHPESIYDENSEKLFNYFFNVVKKQ